jgi:ABC-2 type transport system ATP-binding protein
VAILDHGKLVFEGAVGEMAGGERLRFTVDSTTAAQAALGDRGILEDGAVMVAASRAEAPALIRALVEAGVGVIEARWTGRDLEAFFQQRTGGGR